MKTFDEIKLLVVSELEQIPDPLARDGLETVLIEPRQTLLIWDYGEPGETYPGWMVAEDHETNTGIAWCDQGFGPKNPWGLMSLTDAHMGMDSGWFDNLEEAFCDSFTASYLKIWMVIRRVPGGNDEIIAGPMDMDAAFAIQKPLNEGMAKPCHHVFRRTWKPD